MKKVRTILFALVTTALFLAGCGSPFGKGKEPSLKVYSFSGENDFISVSNGVIILDDEDEICYGGNLEVDPDEFVDIAAYSVTIYLDGNNEQYPLLSNSVVDLSGGTVNAPRDIGKIAGDIIKNDNIDQWNDTLWIEVNTRDLNGEEDTYQLQLEVTEITACPEVPPHVSNG